MPNDRLRDRDRWGYALQHDAAVGAGLPAGPLGLNLNLNRVSDDNYWRDFSRTTASLTQRLLANDGTLAWARGDFSVIGAGAEMADAAGRDGAHRAALRPAAAGGGALRPQRPGRRPGRLRRSRLHAASSRTATLTGQPNAPAQLHAGAGQPAVAGAGLVRHPQAAAARDAVPVRRAAGQRRALAPAARCRPSAWTAAWCSSATPATSAAASARRWSRAPSTCTRRSATRACCPTTTRAPTTSTSPPSTPRTRSAATTASRTTTCSRWAPARRLLDPDTGAEAARFGIAQRLRFKDQRVTLPGGAPVSERLSDLLFGAYDQLDAAVERWTPRVQYNPKTRRSIRSTIGGALQPGQLPRRSAPPTGCSAARASRSTSAGSGRSTTCGATRARTWAPAGARARAAGTASGG